MHAITAYIFLFDRTQELKLRMIMKVKKTMMKGMMKSSLFTEEL